MYPPGPKIGRRPRAGSITTSLNWARAAGPTTRTARVRRGRRRRMTEIPVGRAGWAALLARILAESLSRFRSACGRRGAGPTVIGDAPAPGSRQEAIDDPAADVGQPEVPALEAVREAGVVEAEEAQNRGVVVVDVDG